MNKMSLLKVILPVSTFLVALLMSRLDYVDRDKRTRKFKTLRFWLFVILPLSLIVNIVVVVLDDRVKDKETATLKAQLDTLRRQVEDTKKAVTGGNNLCYVNLDVADNGNAILVIVNDGDTPLYDISFRMWDPIDYSASNQSPKSLEDFLSRSFNANVGNLPPHSAKTVGNIRLPNSDSKNFEVNIIARNGSFLERLKLRKVRGQWKRAYRVHSGHNRDESTVLIEKADTEFPRDSNGKIRWD